ncbi:intermembrane lipid transfer protein Vps13-like [Uloborus diversus]|uniref:intermembrane lipid transfer protein Vps13-like n=1 Tax=Uloborus diversus TaxID=327109 RepID=UPI00240A08E5|nr:intermembrane lipid transfer protein Vps13-like [Uloborus diversus]
MVFESLVASLLNKFLGDYVQNFDSSQLKLGIWGGDVTLKNLDVKESALDDLDLPIKVISGHLGKLVLKIPYKNIYTSPTIAIIEGLFVVVIPNQGIKYDAEKEAKAAQEAKQAELLRIEEAKAKASDKGGGKEEKKDTFTEKLITQIIKNLQVKIKDIHLRYEDNFSDPKLPFSLGFTLHNLSFETTDEKWTPAVIQESVNIIHKLVVLDSLAVYWNSRSPLFHKMSIEDRQKAMEKSIATSTFTPNDVMYMLGPINSKAQLQLNSKPELDGTGFKTPKVWLNVVMEEIAVGLSKLQYQDLIKLLESLDRMTVASLYRKYRPNVQIANHAKQWWQFAITAVLEEDIRRKRRNWSWDNMKSHLDNCKKYKELYVMKLSGKKMNHETVAELNNLEMVLDLFNITLVRKQAELEILRSSKKDAKQQSWGGWFGSFFSKNQHQETNDETTGAKIAKQLEEAMTADEKQKLYEAIGYQEQVVATEYPKEFIENKLLFLLHNLTLVLSDETRSDSQVLKVNLKEVYACIEQRPSAQALSFDSKIESFVVQGIPAKKRIPTIATSRLSSKSNIPLLQIYFETNPLDESCDQRLHVQAQPLDITYDAVTVNSLAEVFKPPETTALQQLQATAMLKFEEMKEMSALGLQHAIELHKYLDLKIDMQPIFIIIPENGALDENSNLIVVSLGNFTMDSHKRDPMSPTVKSLIRDGSTEAEVLSTMIDKAYDKFEISLKNMEILLASPYDDWKESVGQLDDKKHILYPLTINVAFHKSIVTIDPRLPQMRIEGVLPCLDLGVSDYQISQLIKIATSIPLPESSPPPEVSFDNQTLSSAAAADFIKSKTVHQMKKEAVETVKNASTSESDEETISVKEVAQSTSLEFKFEIEQISFGISKHVEKDDYDQNILKFSILKFGTNFTMRTFDMAANMYLGGICLEHFEFKDLRGNALKVISTSVQEATDNLFSLKYLAADKKAPDFASVYESTLQAINADFSQLTVILHQESILRIMDFCNTLLSSAQPALKTEVSSLEIVPVRKKTSSEEKVKSKTVSKKKADDKVIDMKLTAALDSINLLIRNEKYELTDLQIKGMNASVTIQKSKTTVSAFLKDFVVADPTPKALYPQIVSTVAGEVLDVKLSIHNNATDDESYIDMNAVDMDISVSFGRMKIVFLNKFVSSLLAFLDHFQDAKDKVAEASAAAAEVAKKNMEEVYEKSTRILLNIIIQAPVIVTPQNSSSTNAIVADLGILKIINRFTLGEQRNELGIPGIFEKMVLDLQNLQLFRYIVRLNITSRLKSRLNFKIEYPLALVNPETLDVVAQCLILEPISFLLDVIRNHSSNWLSDVPEMQVSGRLAAVKVSLSQDDYNIVMSVLSENLTELPEGMEQQCTTNAVSTSNDLKKKSSETATSVGKKVSVCDVVKCKVLPRFKFDFVMDSVTATLYSGEKPLVEGLNHRENHFSMAAVEIKALDCRAVIMSDSSIIADISLLDVTLDDTRCGRKSGIRRLMERSVTDGLSNMISIEFKQGKEGERIVHTAVSSFSLVFCLEYIMMLGEFFSGSSKPQPATRTISDQSENHQKLPVIAPHSVSEDSLSQSNNAMVIILKLKKPDIVLIENIEDEYSNAIFLNNEIDLRMTIAGPSQSISGSITNLTFYTACFHSSKRHETSAKILSPCDIDIQCNFREHSQHMDIMFRDLILHISPGTVHLITNILSSIVTEPAKENVEAVEDDKDFTDIWLPKSLNKSKFWFLDTVCAEDALEELNEDSASDIIMLFTMRKVVITIEAGVGTRTVPMLLMESSFQADIRDWASNLYVGSSFSLEMSYYNEKIAVWEPLIEPIETSKGHRSWELMMELSKEVDALELSPDDDEPDEVVFEPPQMSIQIVAQDVLELTVSKRAMDVLSHLGAAFQEAVTKAVGKEPPEPYAPYHVNNYLGIPVHIILTDRIFQILNEENNYNCVKLESGCPALNLSFATNKMDPSSRLSILKKQDAKEETYFNIMLQITQEDMVVERKISVACTDKRFYQLPRTTYPGNKWGFVISILSMDGSKFITFHSILKIQNCFSVPIDIYFMKQSLNEVEWCACAESNKVEYLPLHAVYSSTSELFFKPKHLDPSYTLSLPSFVWKDLTDDPYTQKTVFCKDKSSSAKSFYISVSGEPERIYYEETNRKTMSSSIYTLNLSPTAVLRNLLLYPINYSMQGVDKEYCLKEGESQDLWAVDLDKTGLEIRLRNYLDRDWTCYQVLKKEMEELSVWIFESSTSDRTLHLELGMHIQKSKGSLIMQLYSPFCMINKTGLMLTYRGDEDNLIVHPASMNPVLFSFKAKAFFAKKKASLRVEDSEWSDKFSLDAVGSSGTVVTKTKDGRTCGLGVQIKLSQAGLTKMIVFTPYYLLVNNCQYDIEVQESDTSEWIKVPKQECIPFWPKNTIKAEMAVKYCDEDQHSCLFSFKEAHKTCLALKSKRGGITVDCQTTESSIIITFEDYIPGRATALLVNDLENFPIFFQQRNCSEEIQLEPKSSKLFSWMNPLEKRILNWKCGDDQGEHDLLKDGIGELEPQTNHKVYWVSFFDDMQRVLLFTTDLALATAAQEAGELERIEQEITVSLQGVGISLVDNDIKSEIMYMGITSTGIVWESRKKKSKRYKALSIKDGDIIELAYQKYHNEIKVGRKPKSRVLLHNRIEIDFEEMVMTKPNVRCLRRTYQTGLWLQYKTSPHQLQLHAKINRLQIDNQLLDCVFPVVLAPVPLPKSIAAETVPKPFTELSVMLRKAEHSAVPQFKYCKMLIQEFHIKLDQGFINSMLLFFTADQAPEIDHVKILGLDKALTESSLKDVAAVYCSQEQQNYFDNLHFSPLKVHISFSMTGGSQDSNKPTAIHSDFLNLLLQSVGVTLTEIQDVIFKLDYFERQHVFISQKQLISEVTSHYVGQAVKQLYMLVLGLDVIGNPVGLLIGLGEGVTDLFYEPFQGAIQGPEEFAEGLALGVKSLFGHAIGGAAGAASRITGTLGKGIAALTLDKDYQKKRRQNISRRPQDFTHGIAESGKGLVMGVFDGVTGIVTKPIEGAREGGVGGFFKGVGKGLIGVVTRPTAGVVDFASGSLEAVKRVTQVSDEVKRLRVPRFVQPDGIIRPYVKREAEGNKLLLEVEKGKYSNTDVYLAHVPVSDEKLFLLVTNNRVMYIEKGEIFGQWNTVWEYRFEEIKEPPAVTDKGLRIMLKEPQKKGIFSKSVAGKLVHIVDPVTCKWIADKITEALRK